MAQALITTTAAPGDQPAPAQAASTALRVQGISKEYGGVAALSNVTFAVPTGRIVGLIGPNGAGKTTLIDVVAGLLRPTTGQVFIHATETTGWPAHRLAAAGVARTYQQVRLVPDMPVIDNIILGYHKRQTTGFVSTIFNTRPERDGERAARNEATRLLDLVGLPQHAGRLAGELSFGEQRRIEIARALAMDPTLILMDEPTAGVTSREIGRLLELIDGIRKIQRTILLVEHNMRVVREICDHVIVMNLGSVLTQGVPAAVLSDPVVIRAYLGQGTS
jgi:ABC-type branched-subunit amino acid transport system ATPase component